MPQPELTASVWTRCVANRIPAINANILDLKATTLHTQVYNRQTNLWRTTLTTWYPKGFNPCIMKFLWKVKTQSGLCNLWLVLLHFGLPLKSLESMFSSRVSGWMSMFSLIAKISSKKEIAQYNVGSVMWRELIMKGLSSNSPIWRQRDGFLKQQEMVNLQAA